MTSNLNKTKTIKLRNMKQRIKALHICKELFIYLTRIEIEQRSNELPFNSGGSNPGYGWFTGLSNTVKDTILCATCSTARGKTWSDLA